MRKRELFSEEKTGKMRNVSRFPKTLYPQERDWTCSIACIRTMLSGMPESAASEDDYIKKYALTPAPYYSRQIKALGVLDGLDVLFGCDSAKPANLGDMTRLMESGYSVMIESLVNGAHWMVLLGYAVCGGAEQLDCHSAIFFDPYYNKVRIINAEEFSSEWACSDKKSSGVERDFIAVRAVDPDAK